MLILAGPFDQLRNRVMCSKRAWAMAISALLALDNAAGFLLQPAGRSAVAATLNPAKCSVTAESVVVAAKKRPAEVEDVGPIDPRREALEGVLYQIERSYGRGSILKLGETTRMAVECTSTGSLTLDIATGGGYPKGRVIEIYGPESSGKTTLALHAIAEIQKAGGYAAFIDAEHALDPVYAGKVGVDTDQLLVSQPDCGEMALDIVDQLIRSQAVDIVVVDSVAALVPRAELEGDMGDTQMGLQARLMSKAMRKITGSLAKSKCTVIFLNQLRSKLGVFFGNPEVTSGGNALKYFSSLRLDIRRKEVLKDETGIHCKVKVVKNKVAPPFKVVELDILFGRGIDKEGGLVDAAESIGVLERKGAWYSYKGQNVAQGRAKLSDLIASDKGLREAIAAEVKAKLNPVVEFVEASAERGAEGEEEEEYFKSLPPPVAGQPFRPEVKEVRPAVLKEVVKEVGKEAKPAVRAIVDDVVPF